MSCDTVSDQDKKLNDAIAIIDKKATELGLQHSDTIFEIVNQDRMRELSSYVIPIRFHHWTFGRDYYKSRTLDHYGYGGRLYEMVINSRPAYAWLLNANTLTENKLIVAHVLGHVDFSENNMLYDNTDRRIISTCAKNAEIISDYAYKYGEDVVERWIDACLSLSWNISLNTVIKEKHKWLGKDPVDNFEKEIPSILNAMENYDITFIRERMKEILLARQNAERPDPIMEDDLLLFFIHRAKNLSRWQKDVMAIIREEQRYFRPNIQTNCINEGWATWWHKKIINDLDVEYDFLIEDGEDMHFKFNAMHSNVARPTSKGSMHPYFVGYKIWDYLFHKLQNPDSQFMKDHGVQGPLSEKAAIQQMLLWRRCNSDVSFFRNFLNDELVEDLDIFNFRLINDEWLVTDNTTKKIVNNICLQKSNSGIPRIFIVNDNHNDNGELYMIHDFDGRIMNEESIERVLEYIGKIWLKPIHLETITRYNDEVSINPITMKKSILEGSHLIRIHTYYGPSNRKTEDIPFFVRSAAQRAKLEAFNTWKTIKSNRRKMESQITI